MALFVTCFEQHSKGSTFNRNAAVLPFSFGVIFMRAPLSFRPIGFSAENSESAAEQPVDPTKTASRAAAVKTELPVVA
jgi:hypothetical protein